MSSLLDCLTAPKSIALIGASNTPGKITARPQTFLRQHGFTGRIYPVNPMRETVLGEPAYVNVADIPDTVEHAYVLVDSDAALDAVEQCAEAGVRVVSVLADGFAEAGAEGQERQARLVDLARRAGILLVGPNSMGIVDTRSRFVCTTNAAFRADVIRPGRLAVISQSGSLIGTLLSRGQERGVAFSTLVSVGNEATSGVGDIGSILVEDPGSDGFILFLETIRNPDRVAEFARRARELGKPIVAYMVGVSEEGQSLSVSHTGAMTGRTEASQAFLDSLGIARVGQFDAIFEAPAALRRRDRLSGRPRSATVVTTTGGGGAMVVDQLSLRGVEIAACGTAARETLIAKGIPLGHGKLVDVTLAGANYGAMRAVIETLISDPRTGALVVAIGSSASFNPELAVQPIIDAVAGAGAGDAPVFAFPVPLAPRSIELLEQGGVPAFRSVEACAETIASLLRPEPMSPPDVDLDLHVRGTLAGHGAGVMHEVDAAEVFEQLGLSKPRQVIVPFGGALPAEVAGLSFPVVVKLVSKDLPHKSDIGAIRLGLGTIQEVGEAIDEMTVAVGRNAPHARLEAVLVQEMRRGAGEALIGLTRDPLVGPVVTVAAGGVLTEIYKDASVRPAPVSAETARAMVDEVKAFALMRGYRGHRKGDVDALATAIARLSQLAVVDNLLEAEINPILVLPDGEGVVMLDALIRLG